MATFQNITGLPARGANFFDREAEQRRLWERLETDNVLLLAPRRVGKTSLMFKLRDTAARHGFGATYMSAADVTSEVAFVEKLYRAVQRIEGTESWFERLAESELGRFIQRVTPRKLAVGGATVEFSVAAAEQWALLRRALTRALVDLERRALLLIDELPVFVLTLVRLDPAGTRARVS